MIEETMILEVTGDTQVTERKTNLYSVQVCVDGIAAGDSVVLLDGDAGGTIRWRVVAHATDYVYVWTPSNPAVFSAGIYVEVTLAGGGAVYVTLTYS